MNFFDLFVGLATSLLVIPTITILVCMGIVAMIRSFKGILASVASGFVMFVLYIVLAYNIIPLIHFPAWALWTSLVVSVLGLIILSLDEPGINPIRMRLWDFFLNKTGLFLTIIIVGGFTFILSVFQIGLDIILGTCLIIFVIFGWILYKFIQCFTQL